VCSILLNAYGTPTERAEQATFDRADSTIGSGVLVVGVSKKRECTFMPNFNKKKSAKDTTLEGEIQNH